MYMSRCWGGGTEWRTWDDILRLWTVVVGVAFRVNFFPRVSSMFIFIVSEEGQGMGGGVLV